MKADRGPTRRARKVAAGDRWPTHIQAQAAFETGLASPMVEAAEPEPAVPARSQQPAEPLEPAAVRVLAKPPVRKLAKDLGVDLATLDADRPGRHGHPRATSRPPRPALGRRGSTGVAPRAAASSTGRARDAASRSRASAR